MDANYQPLPVACSVSGHTHHWSGPGWGGACNHHQNREGGREGGRKEGEGERREREWEREWERGREEGGKREWEGGKRERETLQSRKTHPDWYLYMYRNTRTVCNFSSHRDKTTTPEDSYYSGERKSGGARTHGMSHTVQMLYQLSH